MKTHRWAAGLEQLDHVPTGIFERDLGTADAVSLRNERSALKESLRNARKTPLSEAIVEAYAGSIAA